MSETTLSPLQYRARMVRSRQFFLDEAARLAHEAGAAAAEATRIGRMLDDKRGTR